MVVGRANTEGFAKWLLQGIALGVEPIAVDYQNIAFAFFEGGADFLPRFEAALDPTRVKEESKARLVPIPKLLFQSQEGQIDLLTTGANEMNVLISFSSAHRSGEVDVELEQILGQNITGGINMIDFSSGRRGSFGDGEMRDDRLGLSLIGAGQSSRFKDGPKAEARRQRESWLENQRAAFDTIGTDDRRRLGFLLRWSVVHRDKE